jgi:putative endonuclease
MTLASDPRRRFGDRGEDLAAVFFESKGFRIVSRNWRCRMGEIDLIVERDGMIHFVEVKTRRSISFGYPEESVNFGKRERFGRTIEAYLQAANVSILRYQADVLAITILHGKSPEFHYIENAL